MIETRKQKLNSYPKKWLLSNIRNKSLFCYFDKNQTNAEEALFYTKLAWLFQQVNNKARMGRLNI